jgi:hypothetical protein
MASASLATAVAVRVWPSWAVPLTVTDKVGAMSTTAADAALVAVAPLPSLSVEVAITRNAWPSSASAAVWVEAVAPDMLDHVVPLRDCH